MPIEYKTAVPWGRSFEEYCRMFDLSESDLDQRILGCGDGPASFNAEMTRQKRIVISCDPLYAFSASQIRQRIDETFDEVMAQTQENQHKFIWNSIESLKTLGQIRMKAMADFLDDYEAGRAEGRYLDAELPALPLKNGSFDLALCSHFLFLYSDNLSLDFHVASLLEMSRVAREVRVFPILDYNANPSPHLDPAMNRLKEKGLTATVQTVPYEFQKGGNRMLRIQAGCDSD